MSGQDERWEPVGRTPVDQILGEIGYDLAAELREIFEASGLRHESPVLELATGTGRAVAVLTRLGHRVLTGDLTLDGWASARARLGAAHLSSVRFLRLRMERLPFRDNSLTSLVSCTTIHELAQPLPCVEEMVRVLEPGGVLLIADFNEAGFAALEHVHRTLGRSEHSRGTLPMKDASALLRRRLLRVREVHTPLLAACIATKTDTAGGAPGP